MPELPEVETVRDGLARWVTGRVVAGVEITHPRSIRRHLPGAEDLAARVRGAQFASVARRGKFLWLPLSDPSGTPRDEALIGHLGMSGQLLVQPPDAPDEKHLHVRIRFADGGPELRFVDQRTFGGVLVDRLVATVDVPGETVPGQLAHIARDPLDPAFDEALFRRRLRTRTSAIKRALLDQTLVSGIGNIYADESLWRARVHGERPASRLPSGVVTELLGHVREVLRDAIRAGGTSFDALYVNVNGQSGYFDRALSAYGQEGRPCPRCGTPIRRSSFTNRSSFWCPRCQRPPRAS
ncbi:Fpg/Nei family DNA glycosylase [Jatrophihabitans fulvus]